MDTPTQVKIAGRNLVCPHCQNDRFIERRWQLNSSGMTFLNLDWLNETAVNYVCSGCGRIEWFTNPPVGGCAEASECLSCGETIEVGRSDCQKCGWTYKE